MRSLVVVSLGFVFVGILGAQSIAEYGAAAAGGATGGAAGKKVSEGISTIFGKVDKQMAEAAKQGKPAAPPAAAATPETAPAASVPSAPKPAKTLRKKPVDQNVAKIKSAEKDDGYDLVPPPPPIQRVAIGKPVEAPARMASLISQVAPAPVQPVVPPPPPPVTAEKLRTIAPGTNRDDVLKLGTFASRITMIDNGHLAETYRYPVGVVRVSDGVVAAVEVQ